MRVGRGVAVLQGMFGVSQCILMWYHFTEPNDYRTMTFDGTLPISLKALFGEHWPDFCWIEFLGIEEEVGKEIRTLMPDGC